MKAVVRLGVLLAAAAAVGASNTAAFQTPSASEPLAIARILAAKYPAQPIMSYIPALSWSSSIRLTRLTGEQQWRQKAAKQMQVFLTRQAPIIAEPYRLTSLAGALAFAEGREFGNENGELLDEVARFMQEDGALRFATGWTDDMFMASSVLSRAPGRGALVGPMLISYAEKLQRPDGLFIHAANGPHAWGRGNGFALLGVTEALTHLPGSWSDRARVLEIYRKHAKALAGHQIGRWQLAAGGRRAAELS